MYTISEYITTCSDGCAFTRKDFKYYHDVEIHADGCNGIFIITKHHDNKNYFRWSVYLNYKLDSFVVVAEEAKDSLDKRILNGLRKKGIAQAGKKHTIEFFSDREGVVLNDCFIDVCLLHLD